MFNELSETDGSSGWAMTVVMINGAGSERYLDAKEMRDVGFQPVGLLKELCQSVNFRNSNIYSNFQSLDDHFVTSGSIRLARQDTGSTCTKKPACASPKECSQEPGSCTTWCLVLSL
jgi:hypothetical protein